jgi:hypothetical protein
MQFQIVDTEQACRRLLAAPDGTSRERIVDEELIAPFGGLAQFWGTPPNQEDRL